MNLFRTRLLLPLSIRTIERHNKTANYSSVLPTIAPYLIPICCRISSDQSKNPYGILEDDEFEIDEAVKYTDANLESIAEGNPETLQLLKLYQLEIDSLAHDNGQVPEKITESEWHMLLSMPTKNKRANYIRNLWRKELKKRSVIAIKAEKQQKYAEFRKNNPLVHPKLETNSALNYGLSRNTLFYRIYPTDMRNLYNFRLLQAMMFGPDIVIDCGYEDYMSHKELSFFLQQLLQMWSINRERKNPFNMIFCNLPTSSASYAKLCKLLPAIEHDPTFPFHCTEKNYFELYPKEQFVYLTPNTTNVLEKFDGNRVYIIGGLVDDGREQPMSLAKAKRDQIRTAKFPLDKYLKRTIGYKTLRLPQCISIMNDIKDGKDWATAFKHIPEKIKKSEDTLLNDIEERESPQIPKHVDRQTHIEFTYDLLLKNDNSKK